MTTLEEIQMEASSLTAENVQEVLAYIHELKTRRAVQEAGASKSRSPTRQPRPPALSVSAPN